MRGGSEVGLAFAGGRRFLSGIVYLDLQADFRALRFIAVA